MSQSAPKNPHRARVFELLLQRDPAIDGPAAQKPKPERNLSQSELEQLKQTALASFMRPGLRPTRP